ncbi:MAG: DUF5627 domain-containing protein [Chitinophagaceae bacterium]
MKKFFAGLLFMTGALVSCTKNNGFDFPDYDYQTVYFASQFPVRTVELGEDLIVDNSLDNEWKVSIKATIGGTRSNPGNVEIGFDVDNSLLNNLYFSATGPKILPLPASHYTLASNKISIPSGQILGGVEVKLTEAFFNDPLSLTNSYAIPLLMKDVKNADSILRGSPNVANPNRYVDVHWSVKPKDFIVYAIKYVNPWHGFYLRRGRDVIVGSPGNSTLDKTVVRRQEFVDKDEVKATTTKSFKQVELPLVFPNASGTNIPMNLMLTFDDKGVCSVAASGTGYTATGKGAFISKGEKNSWGGIDRDALYLEYSIDHPLMKITSTDTLVMRNRGVSPEYFNPVLR